MRRVHIFVLPFVVFIGCVIVKIVQPELYLASIEEDAVFESLQVIFYLLAAMLCLIASRRHTGSLSLYYAVLALGLFVIASEELSWGQRIFHYETPAYFASNNIQNEVSLHNLPLLQRALHAAYVAVGAYGAFAWLALYRRESQTSPGIRRRLRHWVPVWHTSSYFFLCFFVYALLTYVVTPNPNPVDHAFFVPRDQEPVEMFLAMGVFFWILDNTRQANLAAGKSPQKSVIHRKIRTIFR